ncbi:MAG: hypothetical protein PHS79_04350 [Patescibacteria group bacterium]|nr:hypothetical protein [Patescibacteria group bacterium]
MYAHIDMNSYFASVEQQANPHWRGCPLGVCAYLHKNGCVIAASIEAKKRGAKVGMSLEECRSVCPDMVFVQNDPPKYRAVTSRVFSLLHELTDKVEHYSIDEAFLDLTGWYRDEAEAAWALCKTRLRIQREIGDWLKCSIGIAPSKFLAKLASDLEKPNGLVIINQENLDEVLAKLEVEDAWGIGSRIRKRLNKLGIYTLLDLKHYPVGNLMQVLGKAGWMWHERLCGHDVDRLDQAGERLPKSIGHSFCVPRLGRPKASSSVLIRPRASARTQDQVPRTILSILLRLTERAGRRLRSFGLLTRSMTVEVGVHDVHHVHNVHSVATVCFGEALSDVFSLAHGATQLLESIWDGKAQVSFLAVTLNDLVPPNGQLTLSPSTSYLSSSRMRGSNKNKFEQVDSTGSLRLRRKDDKEMANSKDDGGETSKKEQEASRAVDAIRDRYGEESIVFASMLNLSKGFASDRIGFRKTEGVDVDSG